MRPIMGLGGAHQLLSLPLLSICLITTTAAAAAAAAAFSDQEASSNNTTTTCRCFPGDACWPTPSEWSDFNATLGGKLIATVPIAAVCHASQPWVPADPSACARLQSVWDFPSTHDATPSSPMAPFAANMSCDPFAPSEPGSCELGAYVRYAVNASSVGDYGLAVRFARERNVRLVVRNTGHDYLWKSTGAGALALWTAGLRDVGVEDYDAASSSSEGGYRGKVVRAAAGVLNEEAQAAAHGEGLLVVGGNCPTVGLAGGYTQGGGHGPLSSVYGLSADQVVEWEVVTADGELRVATPYNENADLYWALSGGGGGTYGVVWAVKVKAYPDTEVSVSSLSFVGKGEAFYDVVAEFLAVLPEATEAGVGCNWILSNGTFALDPMVGPGMSAEEIDELMEPTLQVLKSHNMTYDYTSRDFPTLQDGIEGAFPQFNITQFHIGGRFLPKSLFADGESISQVIDTIRFVIDNGGTISGVSLDVSKEPAVPNAAHSLWRNTNTVLLAAIPYDRYDYNANVAAMTKVTEVMDPALESLTLGGGAYLNEANLQLADWKYAFYGDKYERLLSIKQKFDPDDIFYGPTAVGSDAWVEESDGRLCRA